MSNTRKELGRITDVRFGIGGYDDAMLGMSIEIGGKGWGVSTPFYGTWERDPDERCKWTKQDQDAEFSGAVRKLGKLLRSAKKRDIRELVGTPVECEFDFNELKSWRVLEEVL